MTISVFKRGMSLLIMAFPEKDFMTDITFQYLSDLTDNQFIASINTILKTNQQINKATNIIALIREKGLIKDRKLAGEAWLEVQKMVGAIGSYDTPLFNDSLIQKTVEIIGWRHLCLSENQIADRAHFLKIYDTLIVRDEKNTLEGKNLSIDFKERGKVNKLIHATAQKLKKGQPHV